MSQSDTHRPTPTAVHPHHGAIPSDNEPGYLEVLPNSGKLPFFVSRQILDFENLSRLSLRKMHMQLPEVLVGAGYEEERDCTLWLAVSRTVLLLECICLKR